jgi:ABC-type polysaccharide/polyol phosphate transport system, ATPase component
MLALKAENISKQYRLGQVGTGTLSHDLNRLWAQIRGKEDPYLRIGETNDRTSKGESEYVWSLRDINFEVEQGDAVGIIGRNGAGKSTLLKLLSKVTKPTTGKIYSNGRIASLLEVGTGFHPEMTGRENIYLNGAILGMTRKEINRKFDEIVDFSGVERYIDTPVKRYSSGMYVRLAFAVAAHLESEVLIVDEVLAVGDAEFQKKCLGKMGSVSKGEGRTVLFVSHNMRAVKELCNTAIILDKGRVAMQGNTLTAISEYLSLNSSSEMIFSGTKESDKEIWFRSITLKNAKEEFENDFNYDEEIVVEYDLGNNILLENHDYCIFFMVLDEYKTEFLPRNQT